jgi:hypothetical protein
VVGDDPTKQPHQLDIAARLALEPPARLHSVEIAVDVIMLGVFTQPGSWAVNLGLSISSPVSLP